MPRRRQPMNASAPRPVPPSNSDVGSGIDCGGIVPQSPSRHWISMSNEPRSPTLPPSVLTYWYFRWAVSESALVESNCTIHSRTPTGLLPENSFAALERLEASRQNSPPTAPPKQPFAFNSLLCRVQRPAPPGAETMLSFVGSVAKSLIAIELIRSVDRKSVV